VKLARPFIKWAGGKRQLMPELLKHLPTTFEHYVEPCVGGGALAFELLQSRKLSSCVVNDLSEELINVYRMIKTKLPALIKDLRTHHNESDYYYAIRLLDRDLDKWKKLTDVQRASRFIYINKTCHKGIWRENLSGQCNTPFGANKNPTICDDRNLQLCHEVLQQVEMKCGSFVDALTGLAKNTFAYIDPPYVPMSKTSSFTAYTGEKFEEDAQILLRHNVDRLTQEGVKVLLSNSSADVVYDLYRDYTIIEVDATRIINSKTDKRGKVKEVFIKNY
jgi:DNA adenine methylase